MTTDNKGVICPAIIDYSSGKDGLTADRRMYMFRTFFRRAQKIGSQPNILIKFISRNWRIFRPIFKMCKIQTDVSRFCKANSITFIDLDSSAVAVDILIVASKKDFAKLPLVISQSRKHIFQNELNSIFIVVPQAEVNHEILNNLSKNSYVKVMSQDVYISETNQDRIKSVYPKRYGWVLQQLLKIEFVRNSESNGVLVLDADTVLAQDRNWLDSYGNQILTPTWENHKPYYEFLSQLGLDTSRIEYSFVSHHMLIKPFRLNECLNHFGISSLENLLSKILKHEYAVEESPFSLDYEMYAQFMMAFYPTEIILSKWSNLQIDKRIHAKQAESYLTKHGENYASLSFHI